jgi:hypothetical protein
MHKIFLGWSYDKMRDRVECNMDTGYEHTAANIAASLRAKDAIPYSDEESTECQIRNHLWLPTPQGCKKNLWIYRGGKQDPYLTFGCIHCQRGTTVYYRDQDLIQVLDRFFWKDG